MELFVHLSKVVGKFHVNKVTQAIDSHGNILVYGGTETVLQTGKCTRVLQNEQSRFIVNGK
jgi:hypothetical protein